MEVCELCSDQKYLNKIETNITYFIYNFYLFFILFYEHNFVWFMLKTRMVSKIKTQIK